MAKPRISITIPYFNGRSTIDETLDSILSQNVSAEIEVHVVNDGSPDNYFDELSGNRKQQIQLAFHSKTNGGVASARNFGFSKSRQSSYLMFLDQDDTLRTNALKTLLEALEKTPNAIATYGQLNIIDSTSKTIGNGNHRDFRYTTKGKKFQPTDPNLGKIPSNYLLYDCCIKSPGQALIRNQGLTEVELFNKALHGVDDWDLWLRLSFKGNVIGLEEKTLNYRIHDNNVSNNKIKMRKYGLLMRLFWIKTLPLSYKIKIPYCYALRTLARF